MQASSRVEFWTQCNVHQCKGKNPASIQCLSMQGIDFYFNAMFLNSRFFKNKILNTQCLVKTVNGQRKGSNSGNRLIKWPHFSIYRLSSMNSCLINDSFITFSNKSHTKIVKHLVWIWSMWAIFKLSMSIFFQCSELLNPQVQWVQGRWKNPWLNSIYM